MMIFHSDKINLTNTFYGKEKKSLVYTIGLMNMILHGVEAPNIIRINALTGNTADIQEKDRHDIILANLPFGGKERAEVQQNFSNKTGETAFLFLQHFIKILKAGMVIKNAFSSNTDNASAALHKELLRSCNLHTVLDLPGGTFTGAGVKTVVLFFEKGKATNETWFYQLNLNRNLGKTNLLNEGDLAEIVALQKTKAESENSWTVNIADIDQTTFNLSVKNPNKKDETILREPKDILAEIAKPDKQSAELLDNLKLIIEKEDNSQLPKGWEIKKLRDACKVFTDDNWIGSKDQSTEGIRLIQTGNVGFGFYKDKSDKVRYISEETFIRLKCTDILPNDLLISRLLDPVGKSCIIPNISTKMITGVDYTIVRTKDNLLPEFLLYYQMSNDYLKDVASKITGTTRSKIIRKNLGLVEIPIPPFSEQKRIVKILDKAFEAIDEAKENTEKNLQNVKELFQSKSQAIFDNGKWVEKKLGNCFRLKGGDGLTSKNMNTNDEYDVYGGNGMAGKRDKYNLDENFVILERVDALCGIAMNINKKIWLTDNAFKVIDYRSNFNNSFLTYLLNFNNSRQFARQAAQSVISNSSLKDVVLCSPKSFEIQKTDSRSIRPPASRNQKIRGNISTEIR